MARKKLSVFSLISLWINFKSIWHVCLFKQAFAERLNEDEKICGGFSFQFELHDIKDIKFYKNDDIFFLVHHFFWTPNGKKIAFEKKQQNNLACLNSKLFGSGKTKKNVFLTHV